MHPLPQAPEAGRRIRDSSRGNLRKSLGSDSITPRRPAHPRHAPLGRRARAPNAPDISMSARLARGRTVGVSARSKDPIRGQTYGSTGRPASGEIERADLPMCPQRSGRVSSCNYSVLFKNLHRSLPGLATRSAGPDSRRAEDVTDREDMTNGEDVTGRGNATNRCSVGLGRGISVTEPHVTHSGTVVHKRGCLSQAPVPSMRATCGGNWCEQHVS
jgi:hypothetical protein